MLFSTFRSATCITIKWYLVGVNEYKIVDCFLAKTFLGIDLCFCTKVRSSIEIVDNIIGYIKRGEFLE